MSSHLHHSLARRRHLFLSSTRLGWNRLGRFPRCQIKLGKIQADPHAGKRRSMWWYVTTKTSQRLRGHGLYPCRICRRARAFDVFERTKKSRWLGLTVAEGDQPEGFTIHCRTCGHEDHLQPGDRVDFHHSSHEHVLAALTPPRRIRQIAEMIEHARQTVPFRGGIGGRIDVLAESLLRFCRDRRNLYETRRGRADRLLRLLGWLGVGGSLAIAVSLGSLSLSMGLILFGLTWVIIEAVEHFALPEIPVSRLSSRQREDLSRILLSHSASYADFRSAVRLLRERGAAVDELEGLEFFPISAPPRETG